MMRFALSAAFLTALAGCAAHHDAPAPSHPTQAAPGLVDKGPGIEKFFKLRAPGAPALANDNTLYVRDWPDGVWQLYRVTGTNPTAGPGARPQQLTNFTDGCTGYSLSHDSSRLLAMTAFGGNERLQVYLLDQNNPDPKTNLTPLLINPEAVITPQVWLHDNSGFIYTANDASPNDFHVYRYDFLPAGSKDADGKPTPGKTTKLLAKPGSWECHDITHDSARLLVTEFRSASDSQLHELSASSGDLRPLNALFLKDGQTAAVSAVGYMPDEHSILITSDHEGGTSRLFLLTQDGKLTKPVPALDKFEVDGATINDTRTLLAVVTNEDGYGVPHLYRLPSFEPVQLPAMEPGTVAITSFDGNRLTYSLNNARTPGLSYAFDVPAQGKTAQPPRQLTFADTQGLDLTSFPLESLVKYKAKDGLEVPAFLYLPPGYQKGTAIPFVVNYHGGPEGQFRPGFDRTVQYLLSEGFGVLQPNVRGSTGYGRAYQMMDDYKNRWKSVSDGVDAAQWLVDNGYARPGRIAAYGGSYGGFMAVATQVEDTLRTESGAQKQNLFGASIDVVGIVNMKTFLEQTSGYRRKLREAEYGPLSDPEFLDSISSLKRADKINAPMMIAHGLNDPRVPVGEAMQLAEALQRRGFDPEQCFFHDEGHGFAKLENRLLFAQRMSRFLKQHIAR
ncbi:MAG: S9 family peptidase [Phycisphaerales bacterium]